MSYEIRSIDEFPFTVFSRFAKLGSNRTFRNIDTIFLSKPDNCILKSLFLISIKMKNTIVSNHRNTNCTSIVPIYMSSLNIVTSSTTLIYLSSLSDKIVISDISPTLCIGMIIIDCSYKTRIISILTERLCSMMDDNFFYFFHFL